MDLVDLLPRCTVPLSIQDEKSAEAELSGTGFFVAPGLILTCTHVVKKAHQSDRFSVKAKWEGQPYTPEILHLLPESYPDLALLKLEIAPSTHPCVFLHEAVKPFDKLYSFGYTELHPDGEPLTFESQGKGGNPVELINFKLGDVRRGSSGAPLLNLRTGAVCGVIKLTKGENTLMGGRGISTNVVLSCFPELVALKEVFHQEDNRWYVCLSPPQRQQLLSEAVQKLVKDPSERIDAVKRIMDVLVKEQKKVSELKSVHNMLHEVEAALAALTDELPLFKHRKLRRQDLEFIERRGRGVTRRIEALRSFAEQEMKYLEDERWIIDLLNLQFAFMEGLEGGKIPEMAEVSDELLSRCRSHLQRIDNLLLIAVNQLDRLSDQTLRELG